MVKTSHAGGLYALHVSLGERKGKTRWNSGVQLGISNGEKWFFQKDGKWRRLFDDMGLGHVYGMKGVREAERSQAGDP